MVNGFGCLVFIIDEDVIVSLVCGVCKLNVVMVVF